MLGVFQRQAGAAGYGFEGVFSHPELDVDLVCEALGDTPKQRPAAGNSGRPGRPLTHNSRALCAVMFMNTIVI